MTFNTLFRKALVASVSVAAIAGAASAGVPGYTDSTAGSADFALTADAGYITSADGGVIYMWGFHIDGSPYMQYPGPTLIVDEGDDVTITLSNCLGGELSAENTSLIVPGFAVTATGGEAGQATQEAVAADCRSGGTADPVTYTFNADRPGTFIYQSGTNITVQNEMGLAGALIVRPAGFQHRDAADIPDVLPISDGNGGTTTADDPYNFTPAHHNQTAYGVAESEFDYEYLYVLSDIDPVVHELVRDGKMEEAKNTDAHAVYWMMNGRAGPDTFFPNNSPWLPTQPYGSMTQMQPGSKTLVRTVSIGQDLHPFHLHGNYARVIAKDGTLLTSDRDAATIETDLSYSDYTVTAVPGQTFDAIFEWSDMGMGWDVFDSSTDHPETWHETSARTDGTHGQAIPVALPAIPDLTFGGFWSGSPYLGSFGQLPPGEGGLNLNGGYFFMWHSHNERELVNNDVFPGGMMTMLIVEPFLDDTGGLLTIPRGASFETDVTATN